MKIDAHQHFWMYSSIRDSWIDDTMQVLKRNYLPEDLEPLTKQYSFDGTIAVQADQSENVTIFLLDLADKTEWIFGVIGWIDLLSPNIEKKLEYFSSYKKLKGFRHIVQAEPDDNFMLYKKFQKGIELLKKYDFSYNILIHPHQLPAAINLAEKNPEQKFILNHIAKPFIKNKKMEPWASDINELAKNFNVVCKISGLITEADHKRWKQSDIYPYLDVVFNSFGYDRLLFGSDWPVFILAGSYGQVVVLVEEYASKDSKNNSKIFGENAFSFYNLKN